MYVVVFSTRADEGKKRYIRSKIMNLTFTMLTGDIMIFNYVTMATLSFFPPSFWDRRKHVGWVCTFSIRQAQTGS